MYLATVAQVTRPRGNATRCCCGRSFRPEKDMETYCSRQCARDDTLRALVGEDNMYRQKVQAGERQKNAGRRYVEKLIPRIFVPADHQLPTTPQDDCLPPTPPPKPYPSRQQVYNSTKENCPPRPHAPRPNISSPYALQPRGGPRPIDASTSRLHLPPIQGASYNGPRLAKKLLQKPHHPVSRKEPTIRRSSSEFHLKNAPATHVAHSQVPELRDPPLTYYLQSPHAVQIPAPPGVLAPNHPSAQPNGRVPYMRAPIERHLRHSKSFSPYKPFFPANVPEDVDQDSLTYRISGDVWWVVQGLRETDDVDYKTQFLARQTPRW